MPASDDSTPAGRFRIACDLFEAGVEIKRAQLRRQHPDADDADIERLIAAWLREDRGEFNYGHVVDVSRLER